MTIGAYTFLSAEWRDLEYPADLWIIHNSKLFDQLSICSYDELKFDFDLPSNVIVSKDKIPSKNIKNFNFYLYGFEKAMKNLTTEWKVLLPSDEFIDQRISTAGLRKRLAYPLAYRNLYGNANTEIIGAFGENSYRIHYGNRMLIGDGGPRPPYAGKFQFKAVLNLLERRVLRRVYKDYIPLNVPRTTPFIAWHTNYLRSRDIMSRKWHEEMTREVNSGEHRVYYDELLELLKQPFAYENYKKFWPNSYLRRAEPPEIIIKNRTRFDQVKFAEEDYQN
ncbi:MAG: hypothetical protein ACYDAZ_06860 [Thermoplasmataceae archaeon]